MSVLRPVLLQYVAYKGRPLQAKLEGGTTMGLHFEILAVESDMIYERRGRIERIVGIRPQWHHHPDALRVPESVFSRFSSAFRNAHPKFNYYGPTEYKSQETAQLCAELKAGPW